jgi:hypothetical protein
VPMAAHLVNNGLVLTAAATGWMNSGELSPVVAPILAILALGSVAAMGRGRNAPSPPSN